MAFVEFTFTAWEEEDAAENFVHLTGKPSFFSLDFNKEHLPKRRSTGANYHIEVTLTSDRQEISSDIGPNIAVHKCRAEVHSEEGFLQLTDQHEVFGTFSLEPFNYEPAGVHRAGVDWDPENCYVKLQIRHDTGDEVRLSSDLKVDYRGRITGTKVEQRFANPIRNCIMYKQTALVVLNLNEEGVTEPTCHSEDGENLFAIDPSGEITWRGQVVTLGDEQFLHRIHWLVGDHLFSKMASIDTGERIVTELDPKTGKIMATDI